MKFSVVVLGYVDSKKKKTKKRGHVTILCDAPCVRDVSALFGHGNKANRFHSTHGLPHVETGATVSPCKRLVSILGCFCSYYAEVFFMSRQKAVWHSVDIGQDLARLPGNSQCSFFLFGVLWTETRLRLKEFNVV